MMGTEEPAGSPRGKGEEVKLMFEFFDLDRDGKISREEMRTVLQTLDEATWTDERVDKILSAYGGKRDGALNFSEFWGWVCGHGGKSTADFRPAIMGRALEEDRQRRQDAEECRVAILEKKRIREEKEAYKVKVAQEREEGTRLDRNHFVEQQMKVGVSKNVATELFNAGDQDRDGDLDKREQMWLAQEQVATTKQVRSIYQRSAGAQHIDKLGNLETKNMVPDDIDAVVQAFLAWDKDENGVITPEELCNVLSTLNPKMGMVTVEALRKEIEVDGNGSINITEFIDWLSGEATKKKKMKKKARDEQDAKVALSLHKMRSAEAAKLELQKPFEEKMHKPLKDWCPKKKLTVVCGTCNPGPKPKNLCSECKNKHAWLCHGCGFVSFYDECVQGCKAGKFGWSCISGVCQKKGCGCKKKPDFWAKSGNVHGLEKLSLGVGTLLAEKDPEEPAPPKEGEEPPKECADGVDIGIFGDHACTFGIDVLRREGGAAVDISAAHHLLAELGGSSEAGFVSLPGVDLLGSHARSALINHIDYHLLTADCGEEARADLKLDLTAGALVELIGQHAFARIAQLFPGGGYNEIKLRRCEAHGKCINFHTDFSRRTLQVALNDDTEYSGGRLVFVNSSGFLTPRRPAGSVTIHENDILHGVTQLKGGVRYGLFLLQTGCDLIH